MKKTILALALAGSCVLAGCSSSGQESVKASTTESSAAEAGASAISVESCGRTIELDKAPERVVFLNATGVAQMADLGLLDKVVARSGTIDSSIYGEENAKKIDALPVLGAAETGHGHSQVSIEALLDTKPDLLIGYEAGVDREKAEQSGIPVYIPESYCPNAKHERGSFSNVDGEVERIAHLFGVKEKGESLNADLASRVEKLQKEHDKKLDGKSAAMLFITPGDTGTISVYGNKSMAQAQLDALGMKNVYEGNEDRVSDISIEDLLEKNPDYVVLLHTSGTSEEVMDTFKQIRGVEKLAATEGKHVVTLAYPFVDPPSPLSVAGLEKLQDELLAKTQ